MGGLPERFEGLRGVLWCSGALRPASPRKGASTKSGNVRSGCSSRRSIFGFPHPGDRSLNPGDLNHKTGDLMEQLQNGVTADTVGACLMAPLSFSTGILTFNLPLYSLLTPILKSQNSFSHSHSSNQITSSTPSFPFPSFSNREFPTGLYCLVYIRPVFNVPPSRTHLRDRWFRFYIYVLASCVT